MEIYRFTGLFVITFLLFITFIANGEELDKIENQVNTSEDAIYIAIKYTGFEMAKNLKAEEMAKMTKITTISDDKTPYLHTKINNKQVWEIIFEDINICSNDNAEKKCFRSFKVYIDQQSGRLLKIYSIMDGYDKGKSPLPSAERAEQQMGTSEIYLGFPDTLPEYTFFEALSNTAHKAENAGEIIANYVVESYMGSEPRRIWAIDLRGLDPIPIASRYASMYVPDYQRNHRRTVIDAKTRHQMFNSTIPQGRLESKSKTNQSSEKNK